MNFFSILDSNSKVHIHALLSYGCNSNCQQTESLLPERGCRYCAYWGKKIIVMNWFVNLIVDIIAIFFIQLSFLFLSINHISNKML